MEKAKLSVKVTENNKIVAELEFAGGKKMHAPGLKLKDTALNGADVEVEREKGLIVLIKMDDNILFSADTRKDKAPPRPVTSHKPVKVHQAEASRPEQQPQHVSHVRDPAYAPYNFVPLNKEIVESNSDIPPMKTNKYDKERNTGWIDLQIEAISPLYIRGTLTKAEVAEGLDSKDKPGFCAPVQRIRIPGSSLRGMTRNMVEIVSFGKFPFCEDRRLYYRGLADMSSLRDEYRNRMSTSDRQSKKTQYHFSAGVLQKSKKSEKGLHYEIRSSGSNFKQVFKSEAQEWVREIGKKYDEFKHYRLDDGFLVVSGDIPNQKKRDWLISHPPENAEVIPIPDRDVQSYNKDPRGDGVPNLLDDARSGKEIPCFFVRWQDESDEERVSFGHTGFFRLAYEKTIGDHIPDSLKDESKTDFAESIFGNEKTYAGRVFFEDAFLVAGQNDPQLDAQTPQILSAPKPTTFQHYLVQNSQEVRRLNHYNSETSIRGYKLYWHKSGERWVEDDTEAIEKHPKQYITEGIRPVKPGTEFCGRIRFENLLDSELGALLFALDLPQGCGHKLGMGKPLGLGSTRITAKLYLSNRRSRYSDLFAEWNNDLPESDELQGKKQEFERYVLNELGETEKRTLWETDRLQELLIMLRFDTGKELERNGTNRYMTIEPRNEFKNRYVLPNASDLVSTSE